MNKKELEQEIYAVSNVEIDLDEYSSWNDLEESLTTQNMFDEEVIYYTTAMEYLSKYDSSLSESLELATAMGYQPNGLSSEILATLLKSQNNRENFYALESDIEDYYSAIE